MSDVAHTPHARRGFLARLGAAAAALAGAPLAAAAAPAPAPDEAWLARLAAAAHRQIFDSLDPAKGGGLIQARNLLNAWRDAHGVVAPAVSVVIAWHSKAAALAFGDDAWGRFDLGAAALGRPGLARNPFVTPGAGDPVPADCGMRALAARGVGFLLCSNSLGRVSRDVAAAHGGTPETRRAELVSLMVPGVVVVPAAVLALGQAQERGASYVFAG